MIAFFEVAIGDGGAAGCSECRRVARVPRPAVDVVAEVRDLTAKRTAPGCDGIAFTGFEPFAHPALPELISTAVSAGFDRIRLRTDAGALASGGNARGALDAGVRHLEIVLLGDEATHDRLTACPGLHAAASSGAASFVAAARQAGLAGGSAVLTGYVPICRHNAASAPAAVAHLAALGAVAVQIDASAASERQRDAVLAALETAAVNGIAGFVTGLRDDPAADAIRAAVPSPQARAPWTAARSVS